MSPDSVESRLARQEERLISINQQVAAVGAVATMVATHSAQIDAHADDINEIKELIRDVRDECRATAKAAQEARRFTRGEYAALLGPVVALVIATVAVILTGHPA